MCTKTWSSTTQNGFHTGRYWPAEGREKALFRTLKGYIQGPQYGWAFAVKSLSRSLPADFCHKSIPLCLKLADMLKFNTVIGRRSTAALTYHGMKT